MDAPDQDLAALLRDAARYLSIQHRTLPLHDTMGVNLTCAGCDLLARLEAAEADGD